MEKRAPTVGEVLQRFRIAYPERSQTNDESGPRRALFAQLCTFAEEHLPDDVRNGHGALPELAARMRRTAAKKRWTWQERVAARVALVLCAGTANEPELGLPLICEAIDIAAEGSLRAPLLAARMDLHFGLVPTLMNAGQYTEAAKRLSAALLDATEIALSERVRQCLGGLQQLASVPDREVALVVLGGISDAAVPLIARCGDLEILGFLDVCETITAHAQATGIPASALFLTWRLAKGLSFAIAATRGSADILHLMTDEQREEVFAAARAARMHAANTVGSRSALQRFENENGLPLLAYINRFALWRNESSDGASDASHVLEDLVQRRLAGVTMASTGLPFPPHSIPSLEETQKLLGDETILVDVFLGSTTRETAAIYTMLITRDDVRTAVVAHSFPNAISELEISGRQHFLSPFTGMIASARQAIVDEPPDDAPVSAAGEALLQLLTKAIFGDLSQVLDHHAFAGKTHLCIVPHGPLHYLPFHLLGETPMADRWIITYLPVMQMLGIGSRRVRRMIEPSFELSVIAVDFLNAPEGFPPLPEAADEAVALGELYGREPVLNQAASSDELSLLLPSSRRVHIATHGSATSETPILHNLLLREATPERESLIAFDILWLDLRGLDVLTLSACETALGRFDITDNLRGLPASFFLAGVSTIVGTLWEAESTACRLFFTTFYAALRDGSTKLKSFAHAQRTTRNEFPDYRDWGAFFFIGDPTEEKIPREPQRTIPGLHGWKFVGDWWRGRRGG